MAKLCEREAGELCVYSRLFLFSVNVETLASRVGVGHSGDLLLGFSSSWPRGYRLSPVRANFDRARSIGERKNTGEVPVPVSVFPLVFFARVRLRSFAKDRWRSG